MRLNRTKMIFSCGSFFPLERFYSLLSMLLLGNANMVMALAGNKADLLDARKVAPEVSTVIICLEFYMISSRNGCL